MFHEGDIVEIPMPDGRTAIGWILHVSSRFKNAIGFVVCGIKGQRGVDVFLESEIGNPTSTKALGPLYTHIDALEHYGWRTVGHQPVSESKTQLTIRKVGGGVYVADDYIGSVEEVGRPDLKPMLAMGMPTVFSEIENAFG